MHRYTLEPYHGNGSRYTCPNCQQKHTFTRYIDTETNTHIADHVGKCDREDNCGYHYPPRVYFASGGSGFVERGSGSYTNFATRTANPYSTLPYQYIEDTTKAYERNNFIKFLTRCFDEGNALRLAALYKIGTSKHWPGATIFWQIDVNDKLRTGKIMLYNEKDGHRVKKPYNHISWVHTLQGRGSGSEGRVITQPEPRATNPEPFKLNQCFFGEHLLSTHPFKTVAIAESEKTAIICAFVYPEYIWLAAGSLDGLNINKCSVLKNRTIILYPDLNCYEKWQQRAREMRLRIPKTVITVNDMLEKSATEEKRARGFDMADHWIDQILK